MPDLNEPAVAIGKTQLVGLTAVRGLRFEVFGTSNFVSRLSRKSRAPGI